MAACFCTDISDKTAFNPALLAKIGTDLELRWVVTRRIRAYVRRPTSE